VLGDFSGDGRVDLIGSGTSPGTTVFLAGQAGGFAAPSAEQDLGCGYPSELAAGDVNGDARIDLVCSAGSVRVLLNLGAGTFAAPQELAGHGIAPVIVDWDHDGDADILANGGTTVFFNDGGGAFPESPRPSANTLELPWQWAVPVDLNGDDVLDVVAAVSGRLSALLTAGDGALGSESPIADYAFFGPPGVGDVSGDGVPDLVLPYNDPSGRIGIATNDGSGRFGEQGFFATASYPTAAAIVDLNSNGKRDIVTLAAGRLSVLLNDGRAQFPTHIDYPIADAFALATGDVDGDGAPDVITVGPTGVSVSRNRGDGTLTPPTTYGPALPGAHRLLSQISSLVVADLTGDSRPEIAVAPDGDIVVHRNNGDGTFGTLLPLAGRNTLLADDPLQPAILVVGHLNDDGIPDLLAVYGSRPRSAVRTYFNDGKGTLWRGEVYALSPSPIDVATGDLNRDGRRDLVYTRP
jgi:hypothetical protein